ncbi:hypothetical protein BDR06DRAFT_1037536 [Suillus hirtellus]|nr:hypothetical protein BDR06DRAFT_1037536 [Suillus hirtellus]
MHNYLLLKHGGGYLLSIIMYLNDAVDPEGASTWDLNNHCIIAALSTRSCTEDQDFLLPFTNAHAAWKALRSHHKQVGPIAQILLIQTPSAPYSPTNICSCLELEQQLVDNDKGKGSGDITMVASNKGKSNHSHPINQAVCTDCEQSMHTSCCTTCGGWWHSAKDCYGKGGAMEGKKDEVIACRHAACSNGNSAKAPGTSFSCSTKGASTSKPSALCYDTNGHAYLLDAETHEAIFITSAPSPSTSDATMPTQEFVGLAYDSPTLSFIEELPEDIYDALFVAVNLQASIDWHTNSQAVDFVSLAYKAPNQRTCTPINPSIIPFFLNSGASVHISNTEANFYTLCPILPHIINGIGNSSIQAVGVSSIQLIIAKGIHLMLEYVLFSPNATVRLLSVSAMYSAHWCITSFDTTSWVQAHMLTRTLASHCL